MGQINITDMWAPTLLEEGIGIVLILVMLIGPIVALICLFRKSIPVFLKRFSMSAIILIASLIFYTLWVYFTSPIHSQVLTIDSVATIICSTISLLCWTYVLKKKEKPRERCGTILSLGRKEGRIG
jgi:hypothetical protein